MKYTVRVRAHGGGEERVTVNVAHRAFAIVEAALSLEKRGVKRWELVDMAEERPS